MEESLSIKAPSIILNPGMTLEGLVSQLQPHTEKLLYVINGITVQYFSQLEECSSQERGKWILQPSTSNGPRREYYLRNTETEDLWCCFDERLRNRLLGMDLFESRLPVVASLIPMEGSYVQSRSHGEWQSQSTLGAIQVLPKVITGKPMRERESQIIDMTSSIKAADPVIRSGEKIMKV